MKRAVAVIAGLAVFAALAAFSGRAGAAEPSSPPADQPYPVTLRGSHG